MAVYVPSSVHVIVGAENVHDAPLSTSAPGTTLQAVLGVSPSVSLDAPANTTAVLRSPLLDDFSPGGNEPAVGLLEQVNHQRVVELEVTQVDPIADRRPLDHQPALH